MAKFLAKFSKLVFPGKVFKSFQESIERITTNRNQHKSRRILLPLLA